MYSDVWKQSLLFTVMSGMLKVIWKFFWEAVKTFQNSLNLLFLAAVFVLNQELTSA